MAKAKYTRLKNGYFEAKVWDGTYKDGKKKYVSLRSKKSSKDLEQKVIAYNLEVENRTKVKNTDTLFIDYARMWKKVYKNQRENNTLSMYENIIEKHFTALPTTRLCDINRIHLQTLLNNASDKIRTQEQIYMTFKQVIESAVSDQLYPANVADNLFRNIERPRYKPSEKRPLTSEERQALFKADFSLMDKTFVYILFGCGLRRGEALALTIFDVNLKNHELTINKSHEFIKDKPKQKSPKSKNGNRTVPIPDAVFPTIQSYVQYRKSLGKTHLFVMRNGEPCTKSSYDKMWKRIVKQMQAVSDQPIEGLTAHVFRHNYCTNLCYQIPIISIKKIAALLGDTDKMVLEVYNHIITEKEDASTAVNNAINV